MRIRNVQVTHIFSPFFYIILHFCLGNPKCNRASMPSGFYTCLADDSEKKNEYGPLPDLIRAGTSSTTMQHLFTAFELNINTKSTSYVLFHTELQPCATSS